MQKRARRLGRASALIVAAAIGGCNGLRATAIVDPELDAGRDSESTSPAEAEASTDAGILADASDADARLCPPPGDPYWDEVFDEAGTWGSKPICGQLDSGSDDKHVNGELACELHRRQMQFCLHPDSCPTSLCLYGGNMSCKCWVGGGSAEPNPFDASVCPPSDSSWPVYCNAGGRAPSGFELRRPSGCSRSSAGRYLSDQSAFEAASVVAFRDLACRLQAFGAPASLVVDCLDAAREETGHAHAVASLARRMGESPLEPRLVPQRVATDLFAFAHDNVIEGLVRETFAAAVAVHQAHFAEDESIRETYRVIAGDELSHAELSRRIHAWALTVLDDGERARLHDVMIRAIDQLRADIATSVDESSLAAIGVPDRRRMEEIHAQLVERLWRSELGAA